jgi:hypothetical protein
VEQRKRGQQDERTLRPTRQCSLVCCSTASSSINESSALLVLLVLSHTMSSTRRKPHLSRHRRPCSNPSPLPHHKNTNDGVAATSSSCTPHEGGGSHVSGERVQPQLSLSFSLSHNTHTRG